MIGEIVADRYRVDKLIGSGGMANVYKAYDEKDKRVVALKVLKDEHKTDPDFLRRFEREAKAVLSLSHPNIVRSFDVGFDDDLPFIVLEYVPGKTLKDVIKEHGTLPPKTAVNITCQVLEALSSAHEIGIIHRDVKPQNVIITPEGVAKLADFGIARDAGTTTRTFAGTNVIGSVHYLSPEQARGDDVTVESDIYSCGIMLYEMLTGNVPFMGDNQVTIALKHLQEDVTPPVLLNPKIPRALSDVVVKASAKKPSQRYATARQMRNDLQRSLKEPFGKFARLDRDEDEVTKRKRRRSLGLGNLILMVLVVVGMFIAMFFIGRSFLEGETTTSYEYIVPPLTGRLVEEASSLAKKRGFVLKVSGYESSDEYPEGQIIDQSPMSGMKGKEGDVLNVIVSNGNDYEVVPNVVGMALSDAEMTFDGIDLYIGEVKYDATSEQPQGQIIKQTPESGVKAFKGDTVDVWISGSPSQNIEMPPVTKLPLDEAILQLNNIGFKNIWIRPIMPEEAADEETVTKQSPAASMSVSKSCLVELWICRTFLGNCTCDMAFNVDIKDTEKPVNVVVTATLTHGIEVVLFETTLQPAAQQSISFTAYMLEAGTYECTLYVGGEKVKSMNYEFALR